MITVIGLGFVGLTTALGFADKGFKVYGYEINPQRVDELAAGNVPFHEPSLPEKLQEHLGNNFILSSDLREAVNSSEVVLFCVGTPSDDDGAVDLCYVESSINAVLDVADDSFRVLCIKSTVPPSTTQNDVAGFVKAKGRIPGEDVGIANNPEFLREGFAWDDFISPDRVVIGANDPRSRELMEKIYQPFGVDIHCVSLNTGEYIKYLSNTLLATMISFANELSMIGLSVGDVDVAKAFHILHEDKRWHGSPAKMSSYVYPGCGFGGYCLPKDTSGLVGKAKEYDVDAQILSSVLNVNNSIRGFLLSRLFDAIPQSSKVVVLGLSFKPGSDDVRMTPAEGVMRDLVSKGYTNIIAFDPLANDAFRELYDFDIEYAETLEQAVEDAEAVVVATAWAEFAENKKLFEDKKVFDLRYCL